MIEPWRPNPVVPERQKRYPRKHYRQVAEVYVEAIEAGTPPGVAIAETWRVPATTARHWVFRARKLGYLPPPTSDAYRHRVDKVTCAIPTCPTCGKKLRHAGGGS